MVDLDPMVARIARLRQAKSQPEGGIKCRMCLHWVEMTLNSVQHKRPYHCARAEKPPFQGTPRCAEESIHGESVLEHRYSEAVSPGTHCLAC